MWLYSKIYLFPLFKLEPYIYSTTKKIILLFALIVLSLVELYHSQCLSQLSLVLPLIVFWIAINSWDRFTLLNQCVGIEFCYGLPSHWFQRFIHSSFVMHLLLRSFLRSKLQALRQWRIRLRGKKEKVLGHCSGNSSLCCISDDINFAGGPSSVPEVVKSCDLVTSYNHW